MLLRQLYAISLFADICHDEMSHVCVIPVQCMAVMMALLA